MSKTGPGSARRDLPAFSRWLKANLAAKARAEGVSVRKFLEARKVNRANIIRWQVLASDDAGPQRETVDREFDRIGFTEAERVEPYGYLGWNVTPDLEEMSSLDAKIKRAEALLRLSLTEAQRAEYERMLADYKAAFEFQLDRFIDRAEGDMKQAQEERERGGHPNE